MQWYSLNCNLYFLDINRVYFFIILILYRGWHHSKMLVNISFIWKSLTGSVMYSLWLDGDDEKKGGDCALQGLNKRVCMELAVSWLEYSSPSCTTCPLCRSGESSHSQCCSFCSCPHAALQFLSQPPAVLQVHQVT